ncbi:MAG: peroxiredoxin-like family protein [Planctomycetota bacterium]
MSIGIGRMKASESELMSESSTLSSPWMARWLVAAGVYNLVWGAVTVLYPAWLFDLTGMAVPAYPFIWQCVGMIVGVYGVGYLAAARDPIRHWPIVLVGFLGKVFGPIGYATGLARGDVPVEFGITLVTNDLVWWIPFAMMLYASFRSHSAAGAAADSDVRSIAETMAEYETESGVSLAALSQQQSLYFVFLRHAGCTFCREALADLGTRRSQIEGVGHQLVLVHQGPPGLLATLLQRHGLSGVEIVSDPSVRLYRAFDLGRGSFGQLFGIRECVRGFAATLRGHRLGRLAGDGFQMPGVFVVSGGRVVAAYRHARASDRPDYNAIACGIASGDAEAHPA